MTNFPAIGLIGNRMFTVGKCRVCGLTLCHEEKNGPPKSRDLCGFHATDNTLRQRALKINGTPAAKKTPGQVLCERVKAKHPRRWKIGGPALEDLIREINEAVA